jgi:carboxylate-amine ligase
MVFVYPPGGSAVVDTGPEPLTVAVVEDLLLIDPVTGADAAVAPAVLATLRLPPESRPCRSVLSLGTPFCVDLALLGVHLARQRRLAAGAAGAHTARLLATGINPRSDRDGHDPQRATGTCRILVRLPGPGPAEPVRAHLRAWLPLLHALAVNSPFFAGTDTGHASWRMMQAQSRAAGPRARGHAGSRVTGSVLELQVGDAGLTTMDTVLMAGLVRLLVATILGDVRAGRPARPVAGPLASAAHWRAAHEGLDGTLIDLRQGRRRPAWDVLDDLVRQVRPALQQHYDLEIVVAELARLRYTGTGATRQRRCYRRTGDIRAMLTELADHTATC